MKPKKNDFEFIIPQKKKEDIKENLDEYLEKLYGEQYCSFIIANYALTDVIEALTAAKVKDIIVTKVDNDLVVKYKPSWRA